MKTTFRLLTAGHHKGRLWLVHFDLPSFPLFRQVAFPSVVLCCTVTFLLWNLIVGIHPLEILIPLSMLILWGWSLMWISSLRVYQWGSPSAKNVTSFQIGFLHDWRNFPGYEMKTSSLDSYGLKQFSCRHRQNMHLRFYKRYGIFYAQNVIEYIECE